MSSEVVQYLGNVGHSGTMDVLYAYIEKPVKKIFPRNWYLPGRQVTVEINSDTAAFFAERKRTETATAKLGKEEIFLSEFLNHIIPGDEVWDIGTYVGVWSIFAALNSRAVHVVAFEPSSICRHETERNISLNKLGEQITLMPIALSNQTGTTALYGTGVTSAAPCLRPVKGLRKSENVKTDTGDNLVHSGDLPKPSIIKCDVEGAEVSVIKGMSQILAGARPPRDIFIEAHPHLLPAFDSNLEEFKSLWRGLPYAIKSEQVRDRTILYYYTYTG